MAALARDGANSERFRYFVSPFRKLAASALPRAIDAYTRSVFEYRTEEVETLKTLDRILDEIEAFHTFSGDCDDVSVFLAALCSALGYRPRFVAIRTDAGPDFSHVFTEVFLPILPVERSLFERVRGNDSSGTWVRFDPTVAPGTIHSYFEAMREYV